MVFSRITQLATTTKKRNVVALDNTSVIHIFVQQAIVIDAIKKTMAGDPLMDGTGQKSCSYKERHIYSLSGTSAQAARFRAHSLVDAVEASREAPHRSYVAEKSGRTYNNEQPAPIARHTRTFLGERSRAYKLRTVQHHTRMFLRERSGHKNSKKPHITQ